GVIETDAATALGANRYLHMIHVFGNIRAEDGQDRSIWGKNCFGIVPVQGKVLRAGYPEPFLAGVCVPPANRVISRGGDQRLAIRRESHGSDATFMACG